MKALLAATSMAALLLAAPSWAQQAQSQQAQSGSETLSAQDQSFIKTAGEGNYSEAQLGALASQKAPNIAVKEFGRWMNSAHGSANRALAAITQMHGGSVSRTLSPDAQSTMQKLQGLSGKRFERAYLQAMVEDHEQDLAAFQKEAQDGQNEHVKKYAQDMVTVIQQHLTEAQDLRHDLFHVASSSRVTQGAG